MEIILNENRWAKEKIESHELGRKPSETLRRVARYYLDSGLKKPKVRRKLCEFLLACDPMASIPKWSDALDTAISRAAKYDAVDISGIPVTVPEMKTIDALCGVQTRRLAFTLLCLSKYWVMVNPDMNGWVVDRDSDVMKMANISTSAKRQGRMYFELRELGLVEFSRKVDNTNVRVTFAQDGDTAMTVTDMRNLGYQYLAYHGGGYYTCAECGIMAKYPRDYTGRGRKYTYCPECAVKRKLKQNVESVMRASCHGSVNGAPVYTVYMHVSPDGKRFVGYTSMLPSRRWGNGNGYSDNERFMNDIARYGWEAFEHYVITRTHDKDEAYDVVTHYIDSFETADPAHGYNRAVRRKKPVTGAGYTPERVNGDGTKFEV